MIKTKDFTDILENRVLVLDGAMGTMIQRLNLTEIDFRGRRFAGHGNRLAGCNDLLCLTQPDIISGLHRAYLEAGADMITTNSFNSNAVSMSDYGIDRYPGIIYELNRTAAIIARDAADSAGILEWGGHAIVAGSIGPTNRAASKCQGIVNPTFRNVTYDELFATFSEQVEGLIDGGVDVLLFETVFDTLNLKAGLDAACRVMRENGVDLPIMVSATLSDKTGRTLSGQNLEAFVSSVGGYGQVVCTGLNCSFGGKDIVSRLRELVELTGHYVSFHPNAGLPNASGDYDVTPEKFARSLLPALKGGLLNIVGGCCGTTPQHIAAVKGVAKEARPHKRNVLARSVSLGFTNQ